MSSSSLNDNSRKQSVLGSLGLCALACALLLSTSSAWPKPPSPLPVHAPNGAVVASQHHLATDAGQQILAEGGNAFDAAVAVSSTLSVVEPVSSGLGGGGFCLLHQAKSGRDVMIDARETAPASATPAEYLDAKGELDRLPRQAIALGFHPGDDKLHVAARGIDCQLA